MPKERVSIPAQVRQLKSGGPLRGKEALAAMSPLLRAPYFKVQHQPQHRSKEIDLTVKRGINQSRLA